MLATRAGLFKRLSVLEDKQRAAWVAEWKPFEANMEDITEAELAALAEERPPFRPELEAWSCEALDACIPRLEAARALEKQWHEDLKPPRADWPSNDPESSFDAPTHALKPYMPAEVCEAYRQWALLLEQHAPASPDPERLQLEALAIRGMAKFTRGYAGLRPWNSWDWKPQVSQVQPSGAPWLR